MIDWGLLRVPITVLLVTLVVSIAVWNAADSYNTVRQDEHARIARNNQDAKMRYDEARRNIEVYRTYLERFLSYRDQGIVGDEKRLRWIEELEAINMKLKLSSLSYEITPQSEAEISGINIPGGVTIYSSRMKLTAGTLHEGDVLHLLSWLRNNADGRFAIRECDLKSLINQGDDLRYQPNATYVNMICDLEWLSIGVDS